jgi:L-alanine-DL-glutamate epimerase-like enolase superfamily enzyme
MNLLMKMVNTRTPSLSVTIERWPIAGAFTISRGAKTEAIVVVAELTDGMARGRGECVPYARYGETAEGVRDAIEGMRGELTRGLDRPGLQDAMKPGAARNALDCAFWDLEAKHAGKRVYELAGLPQPHALVTAFTLSLGSPDAMAQAAARAASRQVLKVKLGADGDPDRIAAVRKAAPQSILIVDANEGWGAANLADNLAACAAADVALVEQPLPAGDDSALANVKRTVPICADESVHDRGSLARLVGRYDAVNIKLDKTGGLTEALAMAEAARNVNFDIMAGCMVATSLAMAPAMLLAQRARFVDLDGPLLLARDRPQGLRYTDRLVNPPDAGLWG